MEKSLVEKYDGNFFVKKKLVENFWGEIFGENFWWKIEVEICWWKFLEEMPYLISLNPLHFKNIAYIGSWKHFVFVFVFVCVCVSLSLYLSFCKYSSRSLSSPDDKVSEFFFAKFQIMK